MLSFFLCGSDDQKATDFLERGNSKFESGDYKGAVKDYTKAIEINPKSFRAYLGRADSKAFMKD
jgi:Tfp pilus assembly protein PilF